MTNGLIALAAFIGIVAVGVLVLRRRRATRRRAGAEAPLLQQTPQEAELTATRRMRIASHDLRAIGMILHGNADHLAAAGVPNAAAIAAAASDIFEMADDLHEYTMQTGTARVLSDDEILLPVALDDALNTVTASIGPGRRLWRISPDVSATRLRADRRALRYMLTRILTVAVRNTHYNDWIDIALQPLDDGLAIVVEDEGTGTMTTETSSAETPGNDSRGLSLRLTLVRHLMQAHGGRAEVEARSGAGTRISLVFPTPRVLQTAMDHSRSAATPPQNADAVVR